MPCRLPQILGLCSLIALFALLVLLPTIGSAEKPKKSLMHDMVKTYFERIGFLPDKKREETIINCCTRGGVQSAKERCSYDWRLAQLTNLTEHDTNFTQNDSIDYREALKSIQALFNEGVRDTPVVRQRLADAKKSAAAHPALFQRIVESANTNVTGQDAPTRHFFECPASIKAQITLLECCQKANVAAECLALCDTDVLKRNATGDGLAKAELRVAQLACPFKAQKTALDCQYTN